MKKFLVIFIITGLFISNTLPAFCIEDGKNGTQKSYVTKSVNKGKKKAWKKRRKDVPDNYRVEYINKKWWDKFNDPILTEYVMKTADSNYDIKINALKVLESHENIKESFGNELPSLTFGPTASREKFSGRIPYGGMFFPSYYAANIRFPLTVNYEVDIWGKNRFTTKRVQKAYEAMMYEEKAAFISLTVLTATTYFNIINLDKQIALQSELVDIRKEILDLTKINYEYGLSSSTDVTVADKLYTEALSDIETCFKYISHVHVAGMDRCLPSKEESYVHEALSILATLGYEGSVSLETELPASEVVLEEYLTQLKGVFSIREKEEKNEG